MLLFNSSLSSCNGVREIHSWIVLIPIGIVVLFLPHIPKKISIKIIHINRTVFGGKLEVPEHAIVAGGVIWILCIIM